MIEVGAHIEAIKQRLGHSSIRTTSDVYGSLLPAVDATVTDHLDASRSVKGNCARYTSPRCTTQSLR
jgi:integrase